MSLGTTDRIYYINHSLESDREGVIFQKYCCFHLFVPSSLCHKDRQNKIRLKEIHKNDSVRSIGANTIMF